MNKTNIIILLSSLIILIISNIIFYNVGKKNAMTVEKIERVTEIVRDTITVKEPVPRYITKTNERVDTIIQYLTGNDTVFVPLSLPIVSKEYNDGRYKAIIKGLEYNDYPKLEEIEVYQTTNIIKEEKTIVKKQNWGWTIVGGVHYGWNPNTKQIEPSIGVTIGYGFRLN